MDFDHVRGVKEFNIGSYRTKSYSLQRIRDEIAKCDVVCSNCHRIRTHDRKNASLV
ncbi:HNH endonuclease [Mycobacterium phage Cosmo]|uniref:HNH endonuclease n=1 Tax=Mycobacterium phage Cosmo TaxID=1567467 RepID=A0A0B5A3C3_9CAUD|nr:HNH endonuclease [Mycobacterium phage Cosmo]